MFINLFKTASIKFQSYTLSELLDVEHGSPISHKMSNKIRDALHWL